MVEILKEMESFYRTKKNIFLALRELEHLNERMRDKYFYIKPFEYHLRDKMLKKMKEVEILKNFGLDERRQTPPAGTKVLPGTP